jgi:hypothetical protein
VNAFVVSGLVKRRADLAGEIERTHESLRKMLSDLETLDATILQFEPDFKVETIKPKAFRPPKDWSNRGQMSRIILSILRQASEPLTSRDIALELLVERALDKNDQRPAADDQAGRSSLTGSARERRCTVRAGAGAVHGLGDRQRGQPPLPARRNRMKPSMRPATTVPQAATRNENHM